MRQDRAWRLLFALAAIALIGMPLALHVWFGFFNATTISLRNRSGSPVEVRIGVFELEDAGRQWNHACRLENGAGDVLAVAHGLKRIEYDVGGVTGRLDLDMWRGEDVVLVVAEDRSLRPSYGGAD